jgi:hypothetical protein
LIWDVCYYAPHEASVQSPGGCEPPVLKDDQGNAVELVVEREIRSERYARVVTAYRPARALTAGARYFVEPIYFGGFEHALIVGDLPEAVPPMPVISAIDYSVHEHSDFAFNARFTFQPFEGTLVVDAEGALADPFEGLEITRWGEDAPVFYLANERCYTNFADARFGAPATVRFGVVDAAGSFSGWTEPVSIEFPVEETSYPEVEAMLATADASVPVVGGSESSVTNGGCSVSGGGSGAPLTSLATLALLTVANAFRGRRRRAT